MADLTDAEIAEIELTHHGLESELAEALREAREERDSYRDYAERLAYAAGGLLCMAGALGVPYDLEADWEATRRVLDEFYGEPWPGWAFEGGARDRRGNGV